MQAWWPLGCGDCGMLIGDGGWDRRSFLVVEEDRTRVGLVSECDRLRGMDTGHDLGQLAATDSLTYDIVTVMEEMPGKAVVHRPQERPLI